MTARTQAGIDDNAVKSLLAVSSADGESIVVVWADPTTHALLVKTVGTGLTLETNGTLNGSQTLLNLVAGTNITLSDNGSGSITIASSGGSGSGYQTPTSGAVNGSNQTFVWSVAPKALAVDGMVLNATSSDGTVNWTGTTTTVLTVAPNNNIFGIA